jgi:hypothetical protein
VLLKIRLAQKAAVRLHERVHLVRDLALVEGIAAFLADQPQSLGEGRVFENVTFAWRAAFAVKRIGFQEPARQLAV